MLLNLPLGIRTESAPIGQGALYWRVRMYANHNGFGTAISASGVQLRESSGGPDLAPSAIVTAAGTSEGNVANLTDGDPLTYWAHEVYQNTWVTFQFSTPKEITSVTVMARSDSAYAQVLSVGELQYSDDGVTWTSAWVFSNKDATGEGQSHTFTDSTPDENAHRYWHLLLADSFWGSNGAAISISDIELRDSSGVDVTGSGTPTASSAFSSNFSIENAFDADLTNLWASRTANNVMHFAEYDFGAGNDVAIKSIALRSREPGNFIRQFPCAVALLYSDDATNWTISRAWVTAVPTEGHQYQIFT